VTGLIRRFERGKRYVVGRGKASTHPDRSAEESSIPLPIPTHGAPQLLKAALNVFIAEE
jgi:hypothetical protein